jgi:MFS family permease
MVVCGCVVLFLKTIRIVCLNQLKVLHFANLFFLGFNLGCAFAPNATSFLGFRFLCMSCDDRAQTFSYSLPSWFCWKRAHSMRRRCRQRPLLRTRSCCRYGTIQSRTLDRCVSRSATLTRAQTKFWQGPAIGPVIGGFLAESVGIQYDFYIVVAICGIAAALGIPFMRESYAPVIRLRRENMAADLEKATVGDPTLTPHHMDKWDYLWINLKRPVILLTRSFICFILSLYMAL